MPEHDRTRRWLLGGDPLQTADPLARQRAERDSDLGRRGREGVVLVRPEAQDPRRLGGAKAERERGAERDRDLAEELTRGPATDDSGDAVDEADRLEATFEHREQRAFVALVNRVFAGHQVNVRGKARKPFALELPELGEDRDAGDLFRCYHDLPPERMD